MARHVCAVGVVAVTSVSIGDRKPVDFISLHFVRCRPHPSSQARDVSGTVKPRHNANLRDNAMSENAVSSTFETTAFWDMILQSEPSRYA